MVPALGSYWMIVKRQAGRRPCLAGQNAVACRLVVKRTKDRAVEKTVFELHKSIVSAIGR